MIDSRFLNWVAQSLSRQKQHPMGLLPDWEIKRLAEEEGMIYPFVDHKVRSHNDRKVVSYGLSSYGYDLRLSPKEFKIFHHIPDTVVDPKRFNPNNLIDAPLHYQSQDLGELSEKFYIMPGHRYGLGFTLEKLKIPSDITVLFIGKSTYARIGEILNLTPGEAGWYGHLTLELSNSSCADCRIYADEGIVQALFFRGAPCFNPYGDGKYQNQGAGIVMARV